MPQRPQPAEEGREQNRASPTKPPARSPLPPGHNIPYKSVIPRRSFADLSPSAERATEDILPYSSATSLPTNLPANQTYTAETQGGSPSLPPSSRLEHLPLCIFFQSERSASSRAPPPFPPKEKLKNTERSLHFSVSIGDHPSVEMTADPPPRMQIPPLPQMKFGSPSCVGSQGGLSITKEITHTAIPASPGGGGELLRLQGAAAAASCLGPNPLELPHERLQREEAKCSDEGRKPGGRR